MFDTLDTKLGVYFLCDFQTQRVTNLEYLPAAYAGALGFRLVRVIGWRSVL